MMHSGTADSVEYTAQTERIHNHQRINTFHFKLSTCHSVSRLFHHVNIWTCSHLWREKAETSVVGVSISNKWPNEGRFLGSGSAPRGGDTGPAAGLMAFCDHVPLQRKILGLATERSNRGATGPSLNARVWAAKALKTQAKLKKNQSWTNDEKPVSFRGFVWNFPLHI